MWESILTHERLKEALIYDPETGAFTNRITRSPTCLAGMRTGNYTQDGYLRITLDRMIFRAHRLAWFWVHGEFPRHVIDHINGVVDDNRICNLRDVPNNVNQQNKRKARSDSTTGIPGIKPASRGGGFEARIQLGAKRWHLGTFKTTEEAHAAYLEAKRKIHEGCTV